MRMTSLTGIAIFRLPATARAAALLAGSLLVLGSFPVSANIIQVAESATGPGGDQCSLIDAIKAANDNKKTGACPAGDDKTNGGDLILLAAGTYKLSTPDNDWYGPNGLPPITSNITIVGSPQGTIIMRDSSQGGSAFRIFYIGGGESLAGYNPATDSDGNPVFTTLPGPGNLSLKNLSLLNGLAQGGDGGKSDSGNGGGGLGAGGAIYNQGTLTLNGVTLNGNQAIGGNGGGKSTSSSSSGNPGGGGGMGGKGDSFGNGGGFSTNGAWPASSSGAGTFGNGGDSKTAGGVGGGGGAGKHGGFGGGGGGAGTGGFGGGAGTSGAAGFGGGGGFFPFDGGGAGMGGALFNDAGTVTILNSTLTANNAQGGSGGAEGFASGSGYGGAIFNLNGTLSVRYSTLAGNTVTFNQVLLNLGNSGALGGAIYSLYLANPGSPAANASSSAHLTINSSILYGSNQVTLSSSGNTATDAVDCIRIGSNFSGSHNNIGASSASCLAGAQTSFPLLLKLGNYGGPTQTMQLLGGLALGGGDTGNAPSLDQRGYLRDPAPDDGAFEFSFTHIAPPAITGLQDATVYAATGAASYPFNVSGSTLAPAGLTVSVNSSDTSLLPANDITLSSGCGIGTSQAACTLNITPPSDKIGNVTITVIATDNYGQSGYASFVLSIIPPPPVASDVSLSTASNQDASSIMKATSAFISQLSYSIVSQPANGSVKLSSAGSSSFTYTAKDGFTGKDSFTFKANDGTSDSNVATVTITVTAPPAVPGTPTVSDLSLTAYENTPLDGTLEAGGASGQPLSFAIVKNPGHGTVKINDVSMGTFTYTPASGYTGTDSFTYSAENTLLNVTSGEATVNLTISAKNAAGDTAPLVSKLTLTTYENVPVKSSLSVSAAAGHAISYANTQPQHGTVQLDSASGNFTYTPATGYTGSDSFTYTATDTTTSLTSVAADVALSVNAIPVSGAAVPIASAASFTTYSGVTVNAVLIASDAAGNALNYVLVKAPTYGTVTIVATTGTFAYTPLPGHTGSDSFTYMATDSVTGVASKAATVSLSIQALPPPAPIAPTANNLVLATYEGVPVSGILTASVSSGDLLNYAISNQPSHGTVAVTAASGAFTYTPAAGYTGTDGFSFTAMDATTGLISAAAGVTLTVNTTPPAPPLPVVSNLSFVTYTGIPVSGTLPATDPSGNPLAYAVTQPAQGSVTVTAATGAFTYTPVAGYSGNDSFTFTATDIVTSTVSAIATVTLTVTAMPASPSTVPPQSNNAAITLFTNNSYTGSLTAADAAGNPLSYAITIQPGHGTVSITSATGAYTYTPAAGYAGNDSFAFTATDNVTKLVSAAATVTLTVATAPPPAAAPLVNDASLTLFKNQSVAGMLSAVAAAGDSISYSVIQPAHGTLVLDTAIGAFTYTPASDYVGKDQFNFTAIDTNTNTASVSATVSLTINATIQSGISPVANAGTLSLYAGQPINGALSAVDAAGNPLSYAIAVAPVHGTVTVTATSGAFTYTP
ncbi:MAG TPA: Ig-like domain-containing protein, partial [Gammaproteobacteria bacterium]|nr:Ig-like domain-containing protein [Gammaproteobacteria bacterium]